MSGRTSGYISRSLCDSLQFFLVPFQLSLLTMSRGGGGEETHGDLWHAWLRRIAIMRSAGLPPMKSHIDLSWENAKEQRVVCQRAVAKGGHLRHAGISRCEHAVLGAKSCTQNQTKTRTCMVMTCINLSILQVTRL